MIFHSQPSNQPVCDVPSLGLTITVVLPPEPADGTMTVFETKNLPGFGPPLHRHREMEVFRVLEGRYLYEVDGKRSYCDTGDVVCVPGGVAHRFVNVSDQPARQLVMMLPGLDSAKFFTELEQALVHKTLDAFGARWGVDFLGPPLKVDAL